MQAKCSGTRRDGKPCGAPTMGGAAFCVSHDPARVVEMAAWRERGGRGKSNAARARKTLASATLSAADLDAVLCSCLAKVIGGHVEPGVGTAAAAIAKAIIGLRQAGQLEAELAEMRAQIVALADRRSAS